MATVEMACPTGRFQQHPNSAKSKSAKTARGAFMHSGVFEFTLNRHRSDMCY
jgi:hypothetical protein